MTIEQIYTGCLAQGAYYIQSNGEAVIIDPLRETQPYIDRLKKDGIQLKYIFETHFHADFVSGHLDLAKKTGATIVYGPNAATSYDIHSATDGEVLQVGTIQFKVLHTPGHTLESTTYLLQDENGMDYALFTGDTLFIGDVGRPDLAQKLGVLTKEDLAGYLFDSLRNKIMPLGNSVLVYPAHGAGSACGKNMSKETFDTLGNQKAVNYALRADMTKAEFIKEVTEGLLPPPTYFVENVALNKKGYESFDKILSKGAVGLTPEEFERVATLEDALILDTRHQSVFKDGFIPNSIFIGIDGGFAPWVGALIPDIKQPILIVAEVGKEEEVITRLARVGYDNSIGFLQDGFEAWRASGKAIDMIESIDAVTLAKQISTTENILDVRKPTEFLAEHLVPAKNFPLDYINNNMDKINPTETYHLHCAGGYRSMIAASILKARGFDNIVDIAGGWNLIKDTTSPKTDFLCPTKMTQEVIDEALAAVV